MNQEYTQRLEKIEKELERWLPLNPESVWADQVFPGISREVNAEAIHFLLSPASELLYRGGKRWRPLLMTLVCETLGGGDAAVPLSPVIEFSHNASLIHDDIEDESDERRGKPAVHKIYGIDTAINSGSFFYFLASCCIDTYADAFKNKELIYKLWTDCMRKLHLGQSIDISWHRKITLVPKIEDYHLMCRLKTGSLTRLAVELGVYTAGAPPEIALLLSEAADKIGVGFQILDDVKNLTTGNPGKKRGDDIVEGKKGFPILLYMHKYPEKQKQVFYCFHTAKQTGVNSPEIEDLIESLNSSGVLTEAEETGKTLLKEAQMIFSSCESAVLNAGNIKINESGRVLLYDLIKSIS